MPLFTREQGSFALRVAGGVVVVALLLVVLYYLFWAALGLIALMAIVGLIMRLR